MAEFRERPYSQFNFLISWDGLDGSSVNAGFRDPWGNEVNLWIKAGDPPQIPDGHTRE